MKRWNLPDAPFDGADEALPGMPPLLAALLFSRGFRTREEADGLLGMAPLSSPYEMIDMDKAVVRIRKALMEEERIAVYGDYDADGVTAAVLLCSYLENEGADVICYIPDRKQEGYGLNIRAIDRLKQAGVALIVTVDNGITALDEAEYTRSLGLGLVITDHHQPRRTLPWAEAIVDPHRPDCPSRFKEYAGVGVALQLIRALDDDQTGELLSYYGDLAVLGTVGDVMPLVGENRTIVRQGLLALKETDREGLLALGELSGFFGKPQTAESVAFTLVPRINAAGRIHSAATAAQLLLCDDAEEAQALAQEVCEQNSARQALEAEIMAEIERVLMADDAPLKRRVLILSGEGWHHGVVGIVAARLCERYNKPCFLLSVENGIAVGSGRSLGDFSLHEMLCHCAPVLTRYGGHRLAAGLTMNARDLPELIRLAEEYAATHHDIMPDDEITVDHLYDPARLTVRDLKSFELLEPFGEGNPPPILAVRGAVVEGIRAIGAGKHLQVRLRTAGGTITAVWFGMREEIVPFRVGSVVEMAYSAGINSYNGQELVSVRVIDMRPDGLLEDDFFRSRRMYEKTVRGEALHSGDLSPELPTREDFAALYRLLRQSPQPGDPERLFCLFSGKLRYCRMMLGLDVLREFGLAEAGGEAGGMIWAVASEGKVNLDDSRILAGLRGERSATVGI